MRISGLIFGLKEAGFRYAVCPVLLVVLFVLGAGTVSAGEALSARGEVDGLHEEIIDLAVASSSALKQQQELVELYEEISAPGLGKETEIDLDAGLSAAREDDAGDYSFTPELGFNLSYPLSDPSGQYSQQQDRLSFFNERAAQKKELEKNERELVRELNQRLNTLFELENSFSGQKRLLSTLRDRRRELKEMVDSGLTEPEDLWELDEKINTVEVEVENLRNRRLILINEIARNFGRDSRGEMKKMLQDIIYYLGEEDDE
ncbi:MAG: TolC family protein [Bacillota bacterium]